VIGHLDTGVDGGASRAEGVRSEGYRGIRHGGRPGIPNALNLRTGDEHGTHTRPVLIVGRSGYEG